VSRPGPFARRRGYLVGWVATVRPSARRRDSGSQPIVLIEPGAQLLHGALAVSQGVQQRRVTAAPMHQARRVDGKVKTRRVHAALDALLAAGREVTVTAVARHAGVSRKFIYSHPPLRAQIELQAAAQAGAPLHDHARLTIASLRADAANYRAQNQRLRQQVTVLQRRLSELLGQQVATDLPDHHELAVDCERELRTELEHALAEAREELAAMREINRELLAAHNRPAESAAWLRRRPAPDRRPAPPRRDARARRSSWRTQ
jgi:hypothetical protein